MAAGVIFIFRPPTRNYYTLIFTNNFFLTGVGVVQVVATFISSLVVDKFGRKILLIISAFFMSFSGALLGVYFTLSNRQLIDSETLSKIAFLPILSLIIFIAAFSFGFGPIPWMASSELMPPGKNLVFR